MKRKQIVFTAPQTAELLETDVPKISERGVLVKTDFTVVSGGTEKANLMNLPNVPVGGYPKFLGYCGIGTVLETGRDVKSVKAGDRVLVYHGHHANLNVREENEITRVDNESVSSLEAAFTVIAAMGLGGVRKLELELGESAMVMGLGLLGMFSVQFLRVSGACPLIAADPNPERRSLALELGADYALDPLEADFTERVKEITHGRGVNATVEVTGVSTALIQSLDCASYMGRISLLGCTRVSDCQIDFYPQVHRPGIKLIGAHNFVRPKFESYPHHWTHHDDCRAILNMLERNRIKVAPMISRVVEPTECHKIYKQLCEDPLFPIGTVFDWRKY